MNAFGQAMQLAQTVAAGNTSGLIDFEYNSNQDIWRFPALAVRDTVIHKNDRICQFRIERHQPPIAFFEVDDLGEESRGGFGSTGIR